METPAGGCALPTASYGLGVLGGIAREPNRCVAVNLCQLDLPAAALPVCGYGSQSGVPSGRCAYLAGATNAPNAARN
jgi:hypothetical protein